MKTNMNRLNSPVQIKIFQIELKIQLQKQTPMSKLKTGVEKSHSSKRCLGDSVG